MAEEIRVIHDWDYPDPLKVKGKGGIRYRWVRMDDYQMEKRKQEGWVPVKPEEVGRQGDEAGRVRMGDLILMKNSVANVRKRKEKERALAEAWLKSAMARRGETVKSKRGSFTETMKIED